MANYCRKCGCKLLSDDNFCYECGTKTTPLADNTKTRRTSYAILKTTLMLCLLVGGCVFIAANPFSNPVVSSSSPLSTPSTSNQSEVTSEPTPSTLTPEAQENNASTPVFNGFYCNNGQYEATEIIQKILSAVESSLLTDEISYGDVIYHFVDDKADCYPSAAHPIYYVISDVSNGTTLNADTYEVMYIIGVGNNVVIDLFFSVSHDFSTLMLIEVTARHLVENRNLFCYLYEDWSQEDLRNTVLMAVAEYMPTLSVAVSNTSITTLPNKNEPTVPSTPSIQQLSRTGDGVFPRFFSETFDDETTLGWEYLGVNGDFFVLPGETAPDWVDVYSVHMKDGSSQNYYIIPYGEIQLTEVYKSTTGTDTQLIWSIPLKDHYEWMN